MAMRNQFDESEVNMDRLAKWEQFRPAADGIVVEAREILNGALPDYAAKLFWLKALTMLDGGKTASLASVVAAFSKQRLRALALEDLGRLYLVADEWVPNADGRDNERIYVVARVIDAELQHPGRPFELYCPSVLFAAVDEALASGDGDSLKLALGLAKQLSATGYRRTLAALPEDGALTALAEDMPNFAPVISFYLGQIALARLAGRNVARFPPVLLLGPPGVGKTLFAECMAAILGSVCRRVSMATATASWILTGLDRSWSSAKPGQVYLTLAESPMANCIMLVDEIDKAMGDLRYDVLGGFYSLLESDTARLFHDEYVGFPIDASELIWIATANDARTIPAPILSRLTVFDIAAPSGALARQIVYRLFDRATAGARFTPLDEALCDLLVDRPPRETAGRLQAAVGRAARRALNAGDEVATVHLEDLELAPPKPAMRFV
jgi:ATP-dependent Lon protease